MIPQVLNDQQQQLTVRAKAVNTRLAALREIQNAASADYTNSLIDDVRAEERSAHRCLPDLWGASGRR